MTHIKAALIGLILIGAAAITAGQDQPQDVTFKSPGGTTLRLMIDETNLGSEVSVGEMTFLANTDSGVRQARKLS